MKRVFYCYSCGEYFKVRYNPRSLDSGELCSHCGSDDTEYSPEENSDDNSDIDPTDDFYSSNDSQDDDDNDDRY